MTAKRLVCGVGINDSVEPVVINKKKDTCYEVWKHMLERCYSAKYHSYHPTYTGCSVDTRWHKFSNFKNWMLDQDYKGKQLDKDLLKLGNKVYAPEFCVFVSKRINQFLTGNRSDQGEYPIGVDYTKNNPNKPFRARCCSGNGKTISLGCFHTPEEAHLAWKAYKHKLACELADEQTDPRVAQALRTRYL